MKNNSKTRYIFTFTAISAFVILLFVLYRNEIASLISVLVSTSMTDLEKREALSLLFGIKGAVIIGVLSTLQIAVPVFPAEPLQVIAGIGYGFWGALIICMAGVFIGNTIMFLMSRIFGNKLTKYLDANIDIDFSSAKAQNKLFTIIFILYILPAIPYGIICFFAASSGLKYHKYILFTFVSAIPSVCIGIALGTLTVGIGLYTGLFTLVLLCAALILIAKNRKAIINAINRMAAPYSTATKVKKPNGFIYFVAAFVCNILFCSRLNIKQYAKIKNIEKPCIIVSNHPSFLDWYYAARVFVPNKLNFITARYYFFRRELAFLLRNAGCMPKSMFSPDFESAKNTMNVIRTGGHLALLPEAQLSTVGRFESIHRSTVEFIKSTALPVYAVHIDGAYLARPKAGSGIRKGSLVEINARKLFEKGETKNMTVSQVRTVLENELYFNDFEWLEKHPELHYKCNTLAKGLENILYLCPKCGKEHTLSTKGNTISCTCGFSLTMNDRYTFIDENAPFSNPQQWYDFQFEKLQSEAENPDYELKANVTLRVPSRDGKHIIDSVGKGVCVLNKNGLSYNGMMDNKQISLDFPMHMIYRLLFGAGEDFEIYHGSDYYSFAPENPRQAVKWYIASIIMSNKYNKQED
ncbi:MAG: VTT domain-containing protein [Clostridia bacterium]|nr:VTT domain-containing protein [Clostridia bacterium]